MRSTQQETEWDQGTLERVSPPSLDCDRADLARLMQGNALMEQGHLQAALGCLAAVTDPLLSADCAVAQAVCWLHLNQPEVALRVCDRALASHPSHSQLWLFRGVALHRLGQYQDAYASYDLATQRVQVAQPVWGARFRARFAAFAKIGKRSLKLRPSQRWVH